jgi:hypothetical protein
LANYPALADHPISHGDPEQRGRASQPEEPAIMDTPCGGTPPRPKEKAEGVATVEVYDLSPNNALLAISHPGIIVEQRDFGGFIVVAGQSQGCPRATGPSLMPFGIITRRQSAASP